MLKNYLKIAFRNLIRFKAYSAINILGLAIGLAAAILIFIFVKDELSYDKFYSNADHIFKVVYDSESDGEISRWAFSHSSWAPEFKANFHEVEDYVRVRHDDDQTIIEYNNNIFTEAKFFFIDSSFFEIFDIELLEGKPGEVLNAPYEIVLSESSAQKYFGDENPQ